MRRSSPWDLYCLVLLACCDMRRNAAHATPCTQAPLRHAIDACACGMCGSQGQRLQAGPPRRAPVGGLPCAYLLIAARPQHHALATDAANGVHVRVFQLRVTNRGNSAALASVHELTQLQRRAWGTPPQAPPPWPGCLGDEHPGCSSARTSEAAGSAQCVWPSRCSLHQPPNALRAACHPHTPVYSAGLRGSRRGRRTAHAPRTQAPKATRATGTQHPLRDG